MLKKVFDNNFEAQNVYTHNRHKSPPNFLGAEISAIFFSPPKYVKKKFYVCQIVFNNIFEVLNSEEPKNYAWEVFLGLLTLFCSVYSSPGGL